MIKSNHKYRKRYYLPIIFSLLYKQSTYQCQKQTKKDKSTANCVMMQLIFDWLFLHSVDSCHHEMVDVEKNVVSLCLILQVNVSFSSMMNYMLCSQVISMQYLLHISWDFISIIHQNNYDTFNTPLVIDFIFPILDFNWIEIFY